MVIFFNFTSPVGDPQGHLLCYKVLIEIIIILKTLSKIMWKKHSEILEKWYSTNLKVKAQ